MCSCLRGLSKSTKNLSKDNQPSDRESNRESLEYNAGVRTTALCPTGPSGNILQMRR